MDFVDGFFLSFNFSWLLLFAALISIAIFNFSPFSLDDSSHWQLGLVGIFIILFIVYFQSIRGLDSSDTKRFIKNKSVDIQVLRSIPINYKTTYRKIMKARDKLDD